MSAYPNWLEAFWLKQALSDHPDDCQLRAYEPAIQALTDLFTTHRPLVFKDYTHEQLAIAYGLFFYPQTFTRTCYPLAEAVELSQWKPQQVPMHILDLGCGLGAAGLAAALWFNSRSQCPIQLTAIDHSSQALSYLKAIHTLPQHQAIQLQTHIGDLRQLKTLEAIKHQQDLIILSFAWNEAFQHTPVRQQNQYIRYLRSCLTPEGLLLIIEPATAHAATHLQNLADHAVAQADWYRWGPGFSPKPFAFISPKNWPHEVRSWEAPDSLSYLNRRLFRDLKVLKFHYALLGLQPPQPHLPHDPGDCIRLVSPLTSLKGKFVFQGLSLDGDILSYELPTRSLAPVDFKLLSMIERGDWLHILDKENLKSHNHFRIAESSCIQHYYCPKRSSICLC